MLFDNKIYACNLTGLAEKDLLCHKLTLKVFSIYSHKILIDVLIEDE